MRDSQPRLSVWPSLAFVASRRAHSLMQTAAIDRLLASRLAKVRSVAPNPTIERTFQRPLRALWTTAHGER